MPLTRRGDDVVDEHTLSAVLSEFARTLTTDFPIQGILEHLVRRVVDVLPVSGAGVSLIHAGSAPHHVAASDALSLDFERLQTDEGEGPCVTAWRTGGMVAVPDLREDHGFPRFSAAARAAGMGAVFAFPLRHGHGRLGALDVYCDRRGPLDPRDTAAAQTLADVAAAYVLNAAARQEARETSDRLRDRAMHDALTGLPNRALLQQRLQHAASRAHRSHTQAAVLFVDLDRFKRVNDRHGHATGDDLLVAVAARLAGEVRPGDTLARVSGDEFVVLCEDLAHREDAVQLAARIQAAVARTFRLPDVDLRVTASVGIAYSGPGEGVSDRLVDAADLAMYRAKRLGGSTYSVGGADGVERRPPAARASPGSSADDARTYRPVVRTSDGSCVGLYLEGAARELDPGRWWEELGHCCTDLSGWPGRPGGRVSLMVTVPVRRVPAPGFVRRLEEVLNARGVDPGRLVLRLTAHAAPGSSESLTQALGDLRDLGVRTALAAVGSGSWSLGALRLLPVETFELDPGVVGGIGTSSSGEALVSAIGDLTRALGRGLTAAGVATRHQHEAVRAAGCEHARGSFYGPAVVAAAVPALLRPDRTATAGVAEPLEAGPSAR